MSERLHIAIDAGHGPETPGKRSPDGTLREFHFNSVTAKYLAEELQKYEGVTTMFTHESSRDVSLKERTNRANAATADLFVSIHANASGHEWSSVEGIETFVDDSRPATAVSLANAVQQQLIQATGLKDRGVKPADYHVLRETNMTAILVECGFMTNRREVELLKSDAYRRVCAAAIAAGIAATYGLKRKEAGKSQAQNNQVPAWAKTAHEWAAANGIYDGTRPNDTLTRAEMITILHRYDQKLQKELNSYGFPSL
ncbi:N-acetylmuramoyl-L-alanine amidase family protein [Marinicrinis lubricantis]|uniref:N-acetylmuramoyl-L-alanine amidase n=1 Tax=Marinicrinis lubricantis TaxID=2086470 RepID=A0ABW1II92_9BACL